MYDNMPRTAMSSKVEGRLKESMDVRKKKNKLARKMVDRYGGVGGKKMY